MRNNLHRFTSITLLIAAYLSGALSAFADTGITNPLGDINLTTFMGKSLTALINVLFPFLVVMYIATGVLFVTARGNPEKLNLAKRALIFTSVGTAIVLGAWVMTQTVSNTVNTITSG